MYAQPEKPKENKSKGVINAVMQKKSNLKQGFRSVDNRPEMTAQRKRQEMANNSPQVRQLSAFQEIADHSFQTKQTPQLQAITDHYAAQQPIQRKGNKTGLPDNLKSNMESLSGMNLDHVKVHYNSAKPAAVEAHAYTQGANIHLANGQEKHLPHELGLVIQQARGQVQPTTSIGGVPVNDNATLENEATRMGDMALQRKSVSDDSRTLSANPALTPVINVVQAARIENEATQIIYTSGNIRTCPLYKKYSGNQIKTNKLVDFFNANNAYTYAYNAVEKWLDTGGKYPQPIKANAWTHNSKNGKTRNQDTKLIHNDLIAKIGVSKIESVTPSVDSMRQKGKDFEEVYKAGVKAQKELAILIRKIARISGAKPIIPKEKAKKDALEKVNDKFKGDHTQITDIARATLECNSYTELEMAYAQLKENTTIMKSKNQFKDPKKNKYRDMNILVKLPQADHIGEIQLQLPEIQTIKSGAEHKLYEEYRKLERKDNPTEADKKRMAEITKISKGLYTDAAKKHIANLEKLK
jgi:hypothetical protein